jgi:hypothetical protein
MALPARLVASQVDGGSVTEDTNVQDAEAERP